MIRTADPSRFSSPSRDRAGWGPSRMEQAGRDTAMLGYVLLGLGVLTGGVTTIPAVLLAYWKRDRGTVLSRAHLDWQIRLFWLGVLALVSIAVLHAVILGLGAITFGIGLVFMVVPWALGLVWLVWSVWAMVHGVRRLLRGLPVG